ncbi:hypothetical protein [Rhodococcus sp. B10]|uniref:hypothetical protein n=1 Tax=Rhodococcus sp. B10 TaxID=2695876 RepID=UPI001432102A|nr:hypothetical protein [Rhodococcus sp. B10]NIL77579.1 hypothetical protein [Rhodococcus sp. B10]
MAEYQITPYVVSVTPTGDRKSPRRMGDISLTEISALQAVTDTFVTLSHEQEPRRRADEESGRQIDYLNVRAANRQVEVTCSLGVSGYNSMLKLAALDVPAQRDHRDTEWFELRAVFAAAPTARAGILLIEGVGSFGMASLISEVLQQGIRANVENVTVSVKPIQDAQAWGETFAAMTTQALEFRTLIPGEVADNAPTGGKSVPLSKILKISRRGGLGPYSTITGKKPHEIADKYGVGSDIDDDTWVVATVANPDRRGSGRKINVGENKVSSISFPVERASMSGSPTDAEFYATAGQIVEDVRQGVGLGNLEVEAMDDAVDLRNVEQTTAANWTVPNEAASS